jgi:putative flippase GtrA
MEGMEEMIAVWIIGGFGTLVLVGSFYLLYKITQLSPEAKKYLEDHPER